MKTKKPHGIGARAKRRPRAAVRARPFGPKRILVPTDFSAPADEALCLAVSIAGRVGGKVSLLYVEPTALPTDVSQLPVMLEHERHKREAKLLLVKLRDRLVPASLRGAVGILGGAPYYEIARAAKKQKSDLIVMGTHGYTGLAHAMLGSVSEQVVRYAPCAVLTVRPRKGKRPTAANIKRILVPVDFSERAAPALQTAKALAKALGAKITLLHVLEPPSYPVFGYAYVPIQERKWREAAKRSLEKLQKGTQPAVRVRTGRAYQEIVAEAKSQKTDLIVVSTHGRTGLAHMLLGSTAERIVRHAPCPVLTVRSAG